MLPVSDYMLPVGDRQREPNHQGVDEGASISSPQLLVADRQRKTP
jgi:hypothetical protein